MVAPDYAAQRSALAKSIGLGRVGDKQRERAAEGQGTWQGRVSPMAGV